VHCYHDYVKGKYSLLHIFKCINKYIKLPKSGGLNSIEIKKCRHGEGAGYMHTYHVLKSNLNFSRSKSAQTTFRS
jgi:hypothetical protein